MKDSIFEPHKTLLLPHMIIVYELFGIKMSRAMGALYNIYNFYADNNLSVDRKTIVNLFTGEHKLANKTKAKLLSQIPGVEYNIEFHNIMHNASEDDKINMNAWVLFTQSFERYDDDFFPLFRRKMLDTLEVEKEILLKIKGVSEEDELLILANHRLIKKLLSEGKYNQLTTTVPTKNEFNLIWTELKYKMLLYLVAYIDAEFSYIHRGTAVKNEHLDKASFVYGILPSFEDNRYLTSIEMLFRRWRDQSGKSYGEMQKYINVDGYPNTKEGSQKTKFQQWRRGKKIAKYEEILNIVKNTNPDIEKIGTWEMDVIIAYRVSVFFTNLVVKLLDVKNDAGDLFKTDREVVKWLHENYEVYYEEAYAEVEKQMESA